MGQMPKILVTGGAGYIGSITTHHLLKRGFDVVVIDDLSRGHRENVAPERLHVLRLQDTDAVARLLKGVDAVVHFAAHSAVGESMREPELYFSNNVGGTVSLLEAMARNGVRRLVFSSTAAVYGDPEKLPIPEDARIAPVNPYGESKAIVEKILRELDHYRGLRSVPLRYFNACGAEPGAGLGEAHNPETHLIPLLFRAVATGEPIQIFGDDYRDARRDVHSRLHSRERSGDGACGGARSLDGGGRVGGFQRRHGHGANRDGSVARGGESHRETRSAQDRAAPRGRSYGTGGGLDETPQDARLGTAA